MIYFVEIGTCICKDNQENKLGLDIKVVAIVVAIVAIAIAILYSL